MALKYVIAESVDSDQTAPKNHQICIFLIIKDYETPKSNKRIWNIYRLQKNHVSVMNLQTVMIRAQLFKASLA